MSKGLFSCHLPISLCVQVLIVHCQPPMCSLLTAWAMILECVEHWKISNVRLCIHYHQALLDLQWTWHCVKHIRKIILANPFNNISSRYSFPYSGWRNEALRDLTASGKAEPWAGVAGLQSLCVRAPDIPWVAVIWSQDCLPPLVPTLIVWTTYCVTTVIRGRCAMGCCFIKPG